MHDLLALSIEVQCQSLSAQIEAEGLKEYAADWLKNAKSVTRDAGGKFASGASGAAKAFANAEKAGYEAGKKIGEKAGAATKEAAISISKEAAKQAKAIGENAGKAADKIASLSAAEKKKVQEAFATATKDPRVQKVFDSLKSSAEKLGGKGKEAIAELDQMTADFKKDAVKALKKVQKNAEIAGRIATTPSVAAIAGISLVGGLAVGAATSALIVAALPEPAAAIVTLILLPETIQLGKLVNELILDGPARPLLNKAAADVEKILKEENEKFSAKQETALV